MLRDAGIDLAELDAKNWPVSVARLTEIAAAVDETKGDSYSKIGFIPWFDQGIHYTWGFDFGGSFFDKESCEVMPTDPNVVEAFQAMYYDWAEEKGHRPSPPKSSTAPRAWTAPVGGQPATPPVARLRATRGGRRKDAPSLERFACRGGSRTALAANRGYRFQASAGFVRIPAEGLPHLLPAL